MSYFNPQRSLFSLLLVGLASSVQSAEDSDWEFTLSFPMVWVVEINGTIDVEDQRLEVNKSFRDKIDALTFGIMTEFQARKGPWRYVFRLDYEESEDDFVTPSFSGPGGGVIFPSHLIEAEIEQGTADATIAYQFANGIELYTGVRHLFSKIDLDIRPLGDGLIEIEEKLNVADEKLYDWLLGLEYRHSFTPNWSALVRADTTIAGDNDKDYSANMLVNYRISKLNNFWFGYRYLRITDKTNEGDIQVDSDFETYGPTIGWAFTF